MIRTWTGHETDTMRPIRRVAKFVDNGRCEKEYVGYIRSMEDYRNEYMDGENECAFFIDKLIDRRQNRIIYVWGDYEAEETYITQYDMLIND